MLTAIKPVTRRILNNIFPPQCISCYTPTGETAALCSACWDSISFIGSPLCDRCGTPFEIDTPDNTICAGCSYRKPQFDRSRSVFKYDDHSRQIITNFKYRDNTYTSDAFARWMMRSGVDILKNSDILAPVPLHRLKLIKRRYNQSALLVNSIAKMTYIEKHNNLLLRVKNTPPQAGLTYKQRFGNMSGAFKLNSKYKNIIKGKRICLVDDVLTTGATIEACAKILKKSGAAKVHVLTLGCTVKG